MDSQVPPAARMLELLSGFIVTQLLHVVAELGIADLLADSPRPVAELAAQTKADPDALARVLRTLATYGVFTEVAPGTVALTPLAATLRSSIPESMRDMARLWGRNGYTTFAHLLPAVRGGKIAFEEAYGTDFYTYMATNPDDAEIFNAAMGNLARQVHATALDAYDLTGTAHIVDVGGGHGYLVAEILRRYPDLRATIFEQPHVAPEILPVLHAAGLAERANITTGDFFQVVPPGGDTYILSMILHNWKDADAIRILTNIRRAMAAGGKILVIDAVLPEGDSPHFGKVFDAVMLACLPGRERTEAEFVALFEQAGLSLNRTIQSEGLTDVLEAIAP